ncbi:hypothetical protein PLUTE_a5014 [Pseudoalteromonas luteoviolacea DSM 6061]|nr:hypothetical protein [Pseudoalteromonas luteoviolacea DSM 6061]
MDAKQQGCTHYPLDLVCYFSRFIRALYVKETMATYIEQCCELSLTTRFAIALKVLMVSVQKTR